MGIYFTLPLSAGVGEYVDKSSELKTTARAFSWSPVKIVSPSSSHLLQAVLARRRGGPYISATASILDSHSPINIGRWSSHFFFSCLGRGFLGWESRCKKTRLQTAAQSSTVVKLTTQQIGSQDTSVEPHTPAPHLVLHPLHPHAPPLVNQHILSFDSNRGELPRKKFAL